MDQSVSFFVLFSSFKYVIQILIEYRIDVEFGIRTMGCRMVGADGSPKLLFVHV